MNDILRAAMMCIACPQCGSQCGPVRCRFYMRTHTEFLKDEQEQRTQQKLIEAARSIC